MNQLAAFLPAAVLFACTPGANNLLSFHNGARQGVFAAFKAVSGRCLAYILMIGFVVAGLGKILETSEMVFQTIKWLGVIYLIWLGIVMIRTPVPAGDSTVCGSDGTETQSKRFWVSARKEFMVAMANPKAILLFGALLPQFIDPSIDVSYGSQMLILGLTYALLEWFTATLYACMGKAAVAGKNGLGRMAIVQKVSGTMLVAIAGMLAFTRRT